MKEFVKGRHERSLIDDKSVKGGLRLKLTCLFRDARCADKIEMLKSLTVIIASRDDPIKRMRTTRAIR